MSKNRIGASGPLDRRARRAGRAPWPEAGRRPWPLEATRDVVATEDVPAALWPAWTDAPLSRTISAIAEAEAN